ncbi:MAG TPA: STAS domain-containing protein [Aquabacterium sp.]|uniref:STAS domain-containing protein n=1 Tax=Aquabacterium sp. TaxID=1872578 RepID=UPI002E30D7A5|nr:STAS domain-containing protein [Aquabacterium sp.]HEX5354674.1 STAS domain-containing protein [Aquabacterium sp.]
MSTTAACLTGEWTIHAIAQQREAMLALVNEGHIEFDASGVTDMDTAGLQLLLSAQLSVAQQGQELKLTHLSDAVKSVLTVYGLDASLHSVYPEEVTA